MPLFKKYHNEQRGFDQPPATGGAGTGAGIGGGPGMAPNDPNYVPPNPVTGPDAGRTHPQNPVQPFDQPRSGAGMGAGMQSGQDDYYGGSGPTGDHPIPPSAALGAGKQGNGQHEMTGKIEHAIGSMIGSKSLKAKGIQKEQEAQAFKVQGSELAEAERLEREALMRRERAVAHGAHPDHKHLGGNPPGSNQTGF